MILKENLKKTREEIAKIYTMIIEMFEDINDNDNYLPSELEERNNKYDEYILENWKIISEDLRNFIILNEDLLKKIRVCSIYNNLIKKKKKK